MALALALDAAKVNQIKLTADGTGTTGETLFTRFFGSPNTPDFPHAGLSQRKPGRASRAHFHTVDQFQVVVGGKGRLGRHDLVPYSIHFSRAYTPYGPLLTDDSAGLTFFFLRTRPDPGPQRLPESKENLRLVQNRRPWQITCQTLFPTTPFDAQATDAVLQTVPGLTDENGLAVYTLKVKPNAKVNAPDPSGSDGQYVVVVNGSLWHEKAEHKAWALVFVKPEESSFQIHAGAQGLEALVLNFPRRLIHSARSADPTPGTETAPGFHIWQCALCEYVYNESLGLPGEGIMPGTRWKDVPENWNCPDCSASKADFRIKT